MRGTLAFHPAGIRIGWVSLRHFGAGSCLGADVRLDR